MNKPDFSEVRAYLRTYFHDNGVNLLERILREEIDTRMIQATREAERLVNSMIGQVTQQASLTDAESLLAKVAPRVETMVRSICQSFAKEAREAFKDRIHYEGLAAQVDRWNLADKH